MKLPSSKTATQFQNIVKKNVQGGKGIVNSVAMAHAKAFKHTARPANSPHARKLANRK